VIRQPHEAQPSGLLFLGDAGTRWKSLAVNVTCASDVWGAQASRCGIHYLPRSRVTGAPRPARTALSRRAAWQYQNTAAAEPLSTQHVPLSW